MFTRYQGLTPLPRLKRRAPEGLAGREGLDQRRRLEQKTFHPCCLVSIHSLRFAWGFLFMASNKSVFSVLFVRESLANYRGIESEHMCVVEMEITQHQISALCSEEPWLSGFQMFSSSRRPTEAPSRLSRPGPDQSAKPLRRQRRSTLRSSWTAPAEAAWRCGLEGETIFRLKTRRVEDGFSLKETADHLKKVYYSYSIA